MLASRRMSRPAPQDPTGATPTAARRSPLHARHAALGAKMADFGGWTMPLEYQGFGVLKEHTAVRTAVGVFDVSHLGKVAVRGSGAADFVNATLSNDLGRIEPGTAQYTLCCDNSTGGVVDDLIAYLRAADDLFLVPNAANSAEVVRRLTAEAPAGVEVIDQHLDFAVLAVQGPRSAELLDAVGLPSDHGYLSFTDAQRNGTEVTVCRTGYTGERGYELVLAADRAGEVWDTLLERGNAIGVVPCGLGARDTLRTEMGYPLHGQDLSADITPVQARLGWAVGWTKEAFWGREVLTAEREAGAARLLWGLESTGRAIPRPHMTVTNTAGDAVGEVTSGTFSPTRRVGIGLALLDRTVAEGDEVSVDVRGRPAPVRVVKPPFVEASTR